MEPITTETIISGKVYCVTAECSSTATETVKKKLERLICRHVSDTERVLSTLQARAYPLEGLTVYYTFMMTLDVVLASLTTVDYCVF